MPSPKRRITRKAPAPKKGGENLNAEAIEVKVPGFLNYTLKQIGEAADTMAGVFGQYNEYYYERFGLVDAKKKAAEIFENLLSLERMVKNNRHYNKNA